MFFLRTELGELYSVFVAKLYNQEKNLVSVLWVNSIFIISLSFTATYTPQSIHIDMSTLLSGS